MRMSQLEKSMFHYPVPRPADNERAGTEQKLDNPHKGMIAKGSLERR